MKKLSVPFIKTEQPESYFSGSDSLIHSVSNCSWPGFNYKPTVSFKIAHDNKSIFLNYSVSEKYILALCTKNNEMVCKDSCVEFFLSPDKKGYYNFEFNCIGTTLCFFGKNRHDRNPLSGKSIDSIEKLSSLGTTPFQEKTGSFTWDLFLKIPLSALEHHKIHDLRGKSFRANFYKCGDRLTEPHFLSWNKVNSDKPDFHRPEFFGEIYFEK